MSQPAAALTAMPPTAPSTQPAALQCAAPAEDALPREQGLSAGRAALYAAAAGFAVLIVVSARAQGAILDALQRPISVSLALLLFLAGAAVIACAASVQRERAWRRSLQELKRILAQVRTGQAPIEELATVDGSTAALVPLLQDLLRELKQQQAERAELREEARQRIARCIDALQRRIGGLRQQAIRDPLTGLHNRRTLDEHLGALIAQARAHAEDLCLLMLDLDHFKFLNDRLGHAEGDRLLRAVGQIIRSTIRQQDVAFRCGGDEFLIIMPGCTPAGAAKLAERLVSLADGLGRTLHVEPRPGLSVGVVSLWQHPGADAAALLAAADKQLYAIKAQRHAQGIRRPRT